MQGSFIDNINTKKIIAERKYRLVRISFFLIIIVYSWFVSFGSWDLLKTERFGISFDFLGNSFLNGTCTIPVETIGGEALELNGKTYMYFGPFPAFLRIVLNMIFPHLFGMWSRISCLLAAIFSLFGFLSIINNQLLQNNTLSVQLRRYFMYISFISFALGSPLIFLLSFPYIYHESILWGFCWSVWAIYFLIRLINSKYQDELGVVGFSICCGLSFLSRPSFGVILFGLLILLLIVYFFLPLLNKLKKGFMLELDYLKDINSTNQFRRVILLLLPVILLFSFQLWYNYCRFETSFKFFSLKDLWQYKHVAYWASGDAERIERAGIFNLKRIPIAAACYFGLKKEYFSKNAPYFKMLWTQRYNNSLYATPNEWIFPVEISSLWIFIGAIIGFFYLLRSKKDLFLKIVVIILFIQVVLILSYMGITYRYSAEFYPLLIFLYSYFLSKLNFSIHLNNTKIILFSTLICAFSIFVNISVTLDWICNYDHDAPIVHKQALKSSFQNIDNIVKTIF